MLLMCFSTARSDTTSWSAMALLERPSAIRASTSRSLPVSAARTLACRVAFSIPLTTSGSNAVPCLGVADRGGDLMSAVGEDLGQARPDHGGVLGDDDAHPSLLLRRGTAVPRLPPWGRRPGCRCPA